MESPGQLRERNGEAIELKFPVHCADPTTERWVCGVPVQSNFVFSVCLLDGSMATSPGRKPKKLCSRRGRTAVFSSENPRVNLEITSCLWERKTKWPMSWYATRCANIIPPFVHHRPGGYNNITSLQDQKYDVGGGERFDSLSELIEHYKKNPMVETTGTVVHLKQPYNATRIHASGIESRVKELQVSVVRTSQLYFRNV